MQVVCAGSNDTGQYVTISQQANSLSHALVAAPGLTARTVTVAARAWHPVEQSLAV